MLNKQSSEGQGMNLKHAGKLVGPFSCYIKALDRYSGKGRQTIKVNYPHVYDGGQVIVDDVMAARADPLPIAARSQQAPALADGSAASEDGEKLREALITKQTSPVKGNKKR